MKRKIVSVIIIVMCLFVGTACGSTDADSDSQTLETGIEQSVESNTEAEETQMPTADVEKEEAAGTFLMTEKNVKLLGRTWMNNDIRWCSYSASGVEFKFYGKKCTFSLRADSLYDQKAHQPRYAIYVDDELVVEEMMDKGIKEVPVFEADSAEEHVIRLVKLSESSDSSLGIQYIICDEDAVVEPTEEKALKIEFVGDSITCGYGVDGELGDSYMTSNENATKAYAYMTAQKLDADYSLVSMSGYGIISGYTTAEKQEKQVMPLYYDKLGNSYGTAGGLSPSDIEWDFSFQPDIVVINLGTNDASYTGNDVDRCEEYVQGYVSFLEMVREKNPNAYIVCALGIMGQDLCPQVEEAVERFSSESGDEKVYYVKLDVQSWNNGYAVDWHPTVASHEHAAEQMVEAISKILEGTYTE